MAGRPDQNEWVRRVLGVDVAGGVSDGRPGGNSVKFQKLRLQWVQTRTSLGAEVQKLQQAILAQTSEEEDFPAIQSGIGVLDNIMSALDERLIDKLDEVYVCEDASKRGRLIEQSKAIIAEYGTFVATDPLMRAIDANPFAPVNVTAQATTVLRSLASELR